MISYKNSIEINKPRKDVFDYLTNPAYWSEYLPCTSDVIPSINIEFSVDKRVTEFLNVLGLKAQIQWICSTNDNFSNFIMDGNCNNFGGSTSQLVYKLSENGGATQVERKIILKQNNIVMKFIEPVMKFFYIFEAKKSLKKAKSILESNS